MRHPDDGNLAALERYMARTDLAEIRQAQIDKHAQAVLHWDWESIMQELGDDVCDCLCRVYWGGKEGMASFRESVEKAAERIAERTIDAR